MSRRETPRRAMSPWARPANDALTWPFADAHARSDRGETTAGAPRQDIAKRPENDEPMREDDEYAARPRTGGDPRFARGRPTR